MSTGGSVLPTRAGLERQPHSLKRAGVVGRGMQYASAVSATTPKTGFPSLSMERKMLISGKRLTGFGVLSPQPAQPTVLGRRTGSAQRYESWLNSLKSVTKTPFAWHVHPSVSTAVSSCGQRGVVGWWVRRLSSWAMADQASANLGWREGRPQTAHSMNLERADTSVPLTALSMDRAHPCAVVWATATHGPIR